MAMEYPKRDKFFAHRFCRLMGKVCIGAEIGPDACWLLTLIAHTEDAAGYRRAVTFFNDDLAARAGMSVSSMIRARTRAVKAGWLNHTKGAKGRASFYFVTVPAWARNVTDSAGDECADEWGEIPARIPCQIEAQNGGQAVADRPPSGGQAVADRPQSDKHSSQENQDNQINQHTQAPEGVGEVIRPPRFEEVRAEWNGIDGVTPMEHVNTLTRIFFGARCMCPLFCQRWRDGIEAVRRSNRCKGESGWRATLKWFLKDGTLEELLNGDFENVGNVGGGRGSGSSVRSPARIEPAPGQFANIRVIVAGEDQAPEGAAGEVPARKAS